jgi:hypothetical protein
MCKPSAYLEAAYFLAYLPIYETYSLQISYQGETKYYLRCIHN